MSWTILFSFRIPESISDIAFFVHNLRRLNFRMGDDLGVSSLRAHQERITLLFGHHRMSFNCQLR
jgi:hypothetical protein